MSKEAILKTIRQSKPGHSPLPKDFGSKAKVSLEELKKAFEENLAKAGANVVEVDDEREVEAYIKIHFKGAIDFNNPEVWSKYSAGCSKNELDKIGVAVLKGQFGVAENGAIWFDESNSPNRLIPFIAQQLVITLNKESIVKDMHEVYRKIDLESVGFGVFISGPSKTADIEQTLVYGAHGATKLYIIIF